MYGDNGACIIVHHSRGVLGSSIWKCSVHAHSTTARTAPQHHSTHKNQTLTLVSMTACSIIMHHGRSQQRQVYANESMEYQAITAEQSLSVASILASL